MSTSLTYNGSSLANAGSAGRVAKRDLGFPDGQLIAACEAARDAMGAFEDGVKRNAPFSMLCDQLEQERSALRAVARIKSGTPRGLAEKALLLDCIGNARGSGRHSESYDLVLSLAADAIALAKGMPNG